MAKSRIPPAAQIVQHHHAGLITQAKYGAQAYSRVLHLDSGDVLRKAGINYGYSNRWAFSFAIHRCYAKEQAEASVKALYPHGMFKS